jgi:zinc protease
VSLSFRAGGVYDPAGKDGLSDLVADVVTKGTPTRSAEQMAATIEGVGGSLSANSGDDFLTISASALSDQLDLIFDLLGDVTRNATFPASELDLARTRELSSLALRMSQPGSVAARFFGKEIYGSNPYGRYATAQSYKAVTRDDVVEFARARLRPAGALLVVAGDVTVPQVESLVAKTFAGWNGAPPPPPPAPAAPARRATDILLVHRPGSVQSVVKVGNTTIYPTDSAYYAARLVTHVLGGGADSRLFLVLREQKSWTYDANAALHRYRGLGYWAATMEVRTEATDSALQELLHQIERIRTDLMPDSELRTAKGFLVGSFPLTIETAEQIAAQVTTAKLLGLDADYLRLYRERLSAVTAVQARLVASRVYHAGALAIVVAGDGAKLYDKLKALAPVRIVDLDGNPLTPEDLTPKAGPLSLDRAQLVSHRDSFVVLVQGSPIGTRTTALRGTQDSLVFTETLTLGPAGGQQLSVVFDPSDLSVTRVDQTGSAGGQQSEVHLRYAAGRVKGSAIIPQQSGTPKTLTIDTTVAPGTYDGNAINVIVPALPLAPGKSFAVPVFSAVSGSAKVLTVKVSAPESVTVPAGTFQAFKAEVSGGEAPFVLYVTSDTPRRIVKLEIVGAPVVFELVK